MSCNGFTSTTAAVALIFFCDRNAEIQSSHCLHSANGWLALSNSHTHSHPYIVTHNHTKSNIVTHNHTKTNTVTPIHTLSRTVMDTVSRGNLEVMGRHSEVPKELAIVLEIDPLVSSRYLEKCDAIFF